MPSVRVQIQVDFNYVHLNIAEGTIAHRLFLAYEESQSEADLAALENCIIDDVASRIDFYIESVGRYA